MSETSRMRNMAQRQYEALRDMTPAAKQERALKQAFEAFNAPQAPRPLDCMNANASPPVSTQHAPEPAKPPTRWQRLIRRLHG